MVIKRQYRKSEAGYFNNFKQAHKGQDLSKALKAYEAKFGKAKAWHVENVRFADNHLYTIFKLTWS